MDTDFIDFILLQLIDIDFQSVKIFFRKFLDG